MYTEIVILAQLLAGPKHGYEIKKSVEKILGKGDVMNNNTLYPALRRLEQMGAVHKEVEVQTGRPNRHVYHVTSMGTEILHDMICEFSTEMARNDAEFQVRVGFFDNVEPAVRRAILAARKEVLQERLHHFEQVADVNVLKPHRSFAVELVAFLRAQVEREIAWIERMETW